MFTSNPRTLNPQQPRSFQPSDTIRCVGSRRSRTRKGTGPRTLRSAKRTWSRVSVGLKSERWVEE
eukprot:1028174-Rhodomonas_salina.1